MNNKIKKFKKEKKNRIKSYKNSDLENYAKTFFKESIIDKYSYNFTWMNLPIIQYPQDILKLQEIIWKIKPDLVIETGVAHGGSIILSASLLRMIDYDDFISGKKNISKRKSIGIDIDIRKHNLNEIKKNPYFNVIHLLEGSSISTRIKRKVYKIAKNFKKILLLLDSNHTHKHVLKELEFYTPLISKGSYCIVYDTFINDLENSLFKNKHWSKQKNPKTAVIEFLRKNKNFKIDTQINNQLLITSARDGYLKKIK